MKKVIVFFACVIVFIGITTAQAVTIFQNFENTAGWTQYIGDTSTAIEVSVSEYGSKFLLTRFITNGSTAYFGTSLGTAAIAAGTGAGEVQEFWVQSDVLFRAGGYSGYFLSLVGLFNVAGDNDNDPALNFAGLAPTPTDYLAINVKNSAAQRGSANVQMASGTVGLTGRITGHVYNSGGQTLMDAAISQINMETGEITYVTGISGYVLLAAGETFDQGLDFFGVRDMPYGSSKTRDSRLAWDNLYFSTEGAYTGNALPSWIPEPATIAILSLGSLMMVRRRK